MKKILFSFIFCFLLFSFSKAEYSQEFQDAYLWAYNNWIIKENSIYAANLDRVISRAEFAEMLVPFAKNIVNMSIPTTYTCWFHDIEWLREWLSTAALQTCTMWLMWQWSTWFRPNRNMTRAELWTVLSRLFWWEKFWWVKPYYINHLWALKSVWIMKKIDNPYLVELKWYVILMFMRSANVIKSWSPESASSSNSNTSSSTSTSTSTNSTNTNTSTWSSSSANNWVIITWDDVITNCWIWISDPLDFEECWRCLWLQFYSLDSFRNWAENNDTSYLECNEEWECNAKYFTYTDSSVEPARTFNSIVYDPNWKDLYSTVNRWLDEEFSNQEALLIKKCEEQRFKTFNENK